MPKPEFVMWYGPLWSMPGAAKFEAMQVRVMARAEGYAMVRRKGAAPFVVSEKDLVNPGAPLLPTTTAGRRDDTSTAGSDSDGR